MRIFFVLFLPRRLDADSDLCQPCDSFVISKIKDAWSKRWNEKKIELVANEQWQNKPNKKGQFSGKLKNPGKTFFLKLAADSVRDVNMQRDENGLTYARKAMIRCGLSKNINGKWEKDQLFQHLQDIIDLYPECFNGKEPEYNDN